MKSIRIPGVGYFSKKYHDWLFTRPHPLKLFSMFYAVSNVLFLRWSVRLNITKDSVIKLTDSDSEDFYLARKSRVPLYKHGVKNRLNFVIKSYFADTVDIESGDVVIDVGANVGELGRYFSEVAAPILICFEPEGKEYECLVKNLPESAACFNYGLWNYDGQLEFFGRNDTADSSLFRCDSSEESQLIEVKRLDSVMNSLSDVKRIKLLKVDGEGAEPEILFGATDTIKKVDYISVDVGPERHGQQNTLVEVFNFLLEHGFILVRFNEKRVTALFKNNQQDLDDE